MSQVFLAYRHQVCIKANNIPLYQKERGHFNVNRITPKKKLYSQGLPAQSKTDEIRLKSPFYGDDFYCSSVSNPPITPT